ncbi:MAG: hypothetical protein EHM71_02630 [Zetaproteobacteria bacterium]|nr:MAG: hypothetical protein EHM71_02630 [Zetaproteobacteria bacterium]
MKGKPVDFEARLPAFAGLTKDPTGGRFSTLHRQTIIDLEQALSAGQLTREQALQYTVRVQHLMVARAAWLRMQLDAVVVPTPLRVN